MNLRNSLLSVFTVLGFLIVSPLNADVIQLDNGDTLNCKILSVTAKEVTIESDALGKVTLPREKVTAIVLGDSLPKDKPKKPAGAKAADGKEGETPLEIIERLAPKDFGPKAVADLEKNAVPAANPDDVIDQLRREGVDPALREALQLRLPGFTAPEVQTYFNDTVDGLITGRLNLKDIRKDAMNAHTQLKELRDDLGPDAAALDGYLGILEGFLKNTESVGDIQDKPAKPMAKPNAKPMQPE